MSYIKSIVKTIFTRKEMVQYSSLSLLSMQLLARHVLLPLLHDALTQYSTHTHTHINIDNQTRRNEQDQYIIPAYHRIVDWFWKRKKKHWEFMNR